MLNEIELSRYISIALLFILHNEEIVMYGKSIATIFIYGLTKNVNYDKIIAWGGHIVLDGSGNRLTLDNCTESNRVGLLNPFRYRSYYYDTETGLYYLQTRYYDPEVGRFITIDDISYLAPDTINGLNLYAYCGNNPVMRVDENGTSWWSNFWNSTVGKVIGWIAVSVLTVTAAVGVIVGTLFTGGLLGAVLVGAGIGALSGITYSIERQGGLRNFMDINPSQVFLSGLVGGAIGAATGAFSYGVSLIGSAIGEYIGFSLSQSTFLGLQIGKVFGVKLMTQLGSIAGGVIGGLLGSAFTEYVLNEIRGEKVPLQDFLKDLIKGELFDWITDLLKSIR